MPEATYAYVIQVTRCEPENGGPASFPGFVPAYYPGAPYHWHDAYGYWYYQPPVSSASLAIDYMNVTPHAMRQIDFGLVARGELVAEVRDVGTFSPHAEIKHVFGLDPNVFPLGTGLSKCVPLEIVYQDGTLWKNPHLPTLRKTPYEP